MVPGRGDTSKPLLEAEGRHLFLSCLSALTRSAIIDTVERFPKERAMKSCEMSRREMLARGLGAAGLLAAGKLPGARGAVGRNGVCTDAVGAAVMGYDPQAPHMEFPFQGENYLRLLATAGVGTNDLARIEVAGLSVQEALHPFRRAEAPAGASAFRDREPAFTAWWWETPQNRGNMS
jgi:hypothetical protein